MYVHGNIYSLCCKIQIHFMLSYELFILHFFYTFITFIYYSLLLEATAVLSVNFSLVQIWYSSTLLNLYSRCINLYVSSCSCVCFVCLILYVSALQIWINQYVSLNHISKKHQILLCMFLRTLAHMCESWTNLSNNVGSVYTGQMFILYCTFM